MPDLRGPGDLPVTPQSQPELLEELVLELTDLAFQDQEGVPHSQPRASALARLVYHPATSGEPDVVSPQPWRFIAPLGPIEAEDLRWYLEEYIRWPSGIQVIQNRVRRVEESLAEWGQQLYRAAFPAEHTGNVIKAWDAIGADVRRRFSVQVDDSLAVGISAEKESAAREAATELLGLPWELLHDGKDYLFQGDNPTRARRRLSNTENPTKDSNTPAAELPIRILLITARPEDEACGYIDHRVSALPLVEAMEQLPGLVEIEILHPPTLPALREALERARDRNEPYHVVHFNGHGVYDGTRGQGGLCFEEPEDADRLEFRRHHLVTTEALGPLFREYRIPLVFLEACQGAKAEKATESVASSLLKNGILSVVAMSHSVLVETARRFVAAFYGALAEGQRVGDAMLTGQRALKDDTRRGDKLGGEALTLEDWFVPVLFQEEADPVLFPGPFTKIQTPQTQESFWTQLARCLGSLPEEPETGFVGRSRELLALERLLFPVGWNERGARNSTRACAAGSPRVEFRPSASFHPTRYAVIRGQGGEGKTALAAEFARWQIRSQQVRRAIFLSVEGLEANLVESVLDALGRQLIKPDFSTQADCGGKIEKAEQEITRALRIEATLLILDNVESILPPPFLVQEITALLREAGEEALVELLALCGRLLQIEGMRLIFTSRETLPEPFDASHNRIELFESHTADAVQLVERVSYIEGGGESVEETSREEIEELIASVHCHARTLTLISPAIRERGVRATRESLADLMVEMESKFPGQRENSLFASVALSLERMSPKNRERVRALAPFQGYIQLAILATMMEWKNGEEDTLANELIETGLATPNPYNHLTLNSALCPYLRNDFAAQNHQVHEGKGQKSLWDTLKDMGKLVFAGRIPDTQERTPGIKHPGLQESNAPLSLAELTNRWQAATLAHVKLLHQQQHKNTDVAVTLTLLDLPNLFALLAAVEKESEPDVTIELAVALYQLLKELGQPRWLAHVGAVRDRAATQLREIQPKESWNHATFEAERSRIEQQLENGQLPVALQRTKQLLQRARQTGEAAYPRADHDLAMACFLLAHVLRFAKDAEPGLHLAQEARRRFEKIAKQGDRSAEGMVAGCLTEQGDCLSDLDRLDEAASTYESAIQRLEKLGYDRNVAVTKGQLGIVRMDQHRYQEALDAFRDARARFTRINEPGSEASSWHQIGRVHQKAGKPEDAEAAYREALSIEVRLGNAARQAGTLGQLGFLYYSAMNRPEEAVVFFRQAADKCEESGYTVGEGKLRMVLAEILRGLSRLPEAREEIQRTIQCNAPFGHTAEPWKSWHILSSIEQDAGNPVAAAKAKEEAATVYFAYRQDGGENHSEQGRIALLVREAFTGGEREEAAMDLLSQLAAHPDADASFQAYFHALQQILLGNRDPKLADDQALDFFMVTEIRLLLRDLEASVKQKS
uniref:Tetratricopeptide repeat-containing protein n=1 Tax=Candidatus Kentrum sp. LFY TaxID=2126342 RepID=A0A450WKD8_9GAMM|nr:MAG: Tetratricopeptide repeat-containing protein [Candidatus Kentron sp. LFY]